MICRYVHVRLYEAPSAAKVTALRDCTQTRASGGGECSGGNLRRHAPEAGTGLARDIRERDPPPGLAGAGMDGRRAQNELLR